MTQNKRLHPEYLVLGKILRPHGIQGELRMSVQTDYPERVGKLKTVYLGKSDHDRNPQPYTVAGARLHKDYVLIRFAESPTRNDAELLRGRTVMVSMADAIPLDDDEFYLYQLIGMQVVTEDQTVIGIVKDIIETGANDVYVLTTDTGEVLVPAHEETLVNIDIDAEIITMKLPDGLLPED